MQSERLVQTSCGDPSVLCSTHKRVQSRDVNMKRRECGMQLTAKHDSKQSATLRHVQPLQRPGRSQHLGPLMPQQ